MIIHVNIYINMTSIYICTFSRQTLFEYRRRRTRSNRRV